MVTDPIWYFVSKLLIFISIFYTRLWCGASRPVYFEGGEDLPFFSPFSTPWWPAAAVAPSGNFLAKKVLFIKLIFVCFGDPLFLPPPPAYPGDLKENCWRKKNIANFLGGGLLPQPPSLPSSTPWRPAAAVAPSGKFLAKFFIFFNFCSPPSPPSLPPSFQHPPAAFG